MAIEAENLLKQFEQTKVTVWYVPHPNDAVEAVWLEQKVFGSLQEAIKAVAVDSNSNGHMAYDLLVHAPDGDRTLSQTALSALLKIAHL